MIAFSVDTLNKNGIISLGDYLISYKLREVRRISDSYANLGYAMIIETNPNEFIVVGKDINVQFSLKNNINKKITGILYAEEGTVKQGNFISQRRLNGDQIMVDYDFTNLVKEGKSGNGLKFSDKVVIQRVGLYQY